ncbi:hypothetical protein OROMI_026490 [Orobanche minor]
MAENPLRNFEAWPNKKAKVEEENIGDESEVEEKEMGDLSKVEAEKIGDKPEVEAEKMESEEEEDLSGYESNNTEETGISFRGLDDEVKKELRRYLRKLAKDGPYEIDFIPSDVVFIAGTIPIDPEEDPEEFERAKVSAQFAIDENNKAQYPKFELESVKRANFKCSCGYTFFLTLVVRDSKSGEKLICRAQVWDNVVAGFQELMEFIVL